MLINRLFPVGFLAALVASPLSVMTIAIGVHAHHTPTHVLTLSVETSAARKKRTKRIRTRSRKPINTKKIKQKSPKVQPSEASDNPGNTPIETKPPTPQPKASPSPRSRITPIPKPTQVLNKDVPPIAFPSPGQIPNPAGNLPNVPKPTVPNLPGNR
jgi:hypothetical protein